MTSSLLGPLPASDTRTSADAVLTRRLVAGTVLADRYRIEKQIGVGGMGVVYKAHDDVLDVDIAVKVLRPDLGNDPEWAERFRRELLLAREVTHRNVVRIHDIGESDGLRFLTMRLIEGRSLREMIEQDGVLELTRALRLFRQVAEALEQAHRVGIVHRDLKPGNILVSPDDEAYITDFGIARSLDETGLTRSGVIVGTFDYLSPEQVAGDPVDPKSDIYALGIVLYEMLSGQLPFRDASRAEALARRMAGQARDLSETGVRAPAYVRRIVRRCLQRRGARRYPNVGALLADLDVQRAGLLDRLPRRLLPLLAAALLLTSASLSLRYGSLGSLRPFRAPPAPAPAPVPAPPSVAVLPFADETGDPGLAWTATGVAEMLTTNLAENATLRVLDSARVQRTLRDLGLTGPVSDPVTQRRLADLLEVDLLVSGSVRRAGESLRLDLRLLSFRNPDAVASRPLGAETKTADGLFGIVAELGERLHGELAGAGDRRSSPPEPVTTSIPAAKAYREGRERLLAGDSVAAAPAFERAIAADPRCAAALEGLSEAYQSLGYQEKALRAAESAAGIVGTADTRLAWRVRARLALLLGKPGDAESAYEQLLQRYPNDTEALLNLATAQTSRGAVTKSIPTLKRLTELDKGDARAWFLLGKNMIVAGDGLKAVGDPLVRALSLMTQLGNEQGQGDVLNAMGVAYQRIGNYPQAVAKYGEAAAIRARIGDQRGSAVSLKNRASIHLATGRDAEAEPDLRAARDIYLKIGDRKGLADVWNDFGVLYEGRGDYAQAKSAYQDALRIRRGLGDEQRMAQSYDNVGYVCFLQGNQPEALGYWRQALELRKKNGDQNGLVRSFQNMGFLHTAQGRWTDAMKQFLQALEKSREIAFTNALAVSHGNIGLLHQYEGRYSSALAAFAEAIEILRKLDDKSGILEFTLKEAQAKLELGRSAEAKASLDRAQPLLGNTSNKERTAEYHALLGEWHVLRGEAAPAKRAFGTAVELATASHSRAALVRARIARGTGLLALAEAAQAGADLESVETDADSVGDMVLRIRASEAQARAQLQAGNLAGAERSARRALVLAQACGFEAGLYRLHALSAQILERRGDTPTATAARRQSARHLELLRASLPGEIRASFDALPTVRDMRDWSAAHPLRAAQ